ncbi:hypothetical protein [Paracoccus denitrificans]|uniref:hypothetical protein n=1 Tax=Paracoccus denitrificans TaxID=266 RepID=UPI003364FFBE
MKGHSSHSPERGGALVMGGERVLLPAASPRQNSKETGAMPMWITAHRTTLGDIGGGICCCVTGYVLFVIAGCLP